MKNKYLIDLPLKCFSIPDLDFDKCQDVEDLLKALGEPYRVYIILSKVDEKGKRKSF